MLLRSLTLAAVLLAHALPAQAFPFPGGYGYIGHPGAALLPLTWEGKPAILYIGGSGDYLPFVTYTWNTVSAPTPVFRLAAGIFVDWRPCASDSEVNLNVGRDQSHMRTLGNMMGGVLQWTETPASPLMISFYRKIVDVPYNVTYCRALSSSCTQTRCFPNYGAAPQLMAMVLVLEGITW